MWGSSLCSPASTPPRGEQLPPRPDAKSLKEEAAKYALVKIEGMDEKCDFCKMMKASPCYDRWMDFQRCVEYHTEKDQPYLVTCRTLALGLFYCIQGEMDQNQGGLESREEEEEPSNQHHSQG